MSLINWAEREVEIACKKENPDWNGESFDYECGCYQSALKAYKSLCEDEHSGMSFSITANILNKLMHNIPLTPIVDTPEIWSDSISMLSKDYVTYQCSRMSSLFKDVYPDGSIKYHDNNRVVFYEYGDKCGSNFGLASNIIDKMFPLKLPYTPSLTPFKVNGLTFDSIKSEPGSFDTAIITDVITPDGEHALINKCFIINDDNIFIEASAEAVFNRIEEHSVRIKSEDVLNWFYNIFFSKEVTE